MRGIVGQRQQVELTLPWRMAAAEPPRLEDIQPKVAGQNGSLPPNLRLKHDVPPNARKGSGRVTAHDGDTPVGELSWTPQGMVSYVQTHDSYKRRGVGSAMWEHAKKIRPDIHHSDEQSDSAKKWTPHAAARTAVTYYHITGNPNFKLDPKFVPENLAEEDEGHYGPGVFLSRDKDLWRDSYGMEDRNNTVAFDAPDNLHLLPGIKTPYWDRSNAMDRTTGPDEVFVPASMYHLLKPVASEKAAAWVPRYAAELSGKPLRFEHTYTDYGYPSARPQDFEQTPQRYPVGFHDVVAYDGDKQVGNIHWNKNRETPTYKPTANEMQWITTHPDYRRKGIATQMMTWAQQNVDPILSHSHNLTDEGAAFSRALGTEPPKGYNHNPPVDDADDWPDAENGHGAKWQGDKWKSDWYDKDMARMKAEQPPEQPLWWQPGGSGVKPAGSRQSSLSWTPRAWVCADPVSSRGRHL